MEFTVYPDGDPSIRQEGFFESKVESLEKKIKELEYENAVLSRDYNEVAERVKKLASRQPAWPKGYRPHKNNRFHKSSHNRKFSNNGKGDITR